MNRLLVFGRSAPAAGLKSDLKTSLPSTSAFFTSLGALLEPSSSVSLRFLFYFKANRVGTGGEDEEKTDIGPYLPWLLSLLLLPLDLFPQLLNFCLVTINGSDILLGEILPALFSSSKKIT